MRVAIVGAGSIGSALGGFLATHTEAHVTLVARGPHLKALQERGLQLTGNAADPTGSLTYRSDLDEAPDVLIFGVKSHDLATAVDQNRSKAADAVIVTIQNGLQAESIVQRGFPDNRVVGCVTSVESEIVEPGIVRVGTIGGFVVGNPSGTADAAALAICNLLDRARMPATLTHNLEGAKWLKLIGNLNNALSAVTGKTLQECYVYPPAARVGIRMMKEGLAAARAKRVRLEPIPWARPGLARLIALLPSGVAGRMMARRFDRLFQGEDVRSSTYQSIRRGRKTEIDFLNGEIVAQCRNRGLRAPVNERVVEMVHEVESLGEFIPLERFAERALARPLRAPKKP